LQGRDDEASRIRAAKVNASRRNGLNDVVAKIGGIFFITFTERRERTPGFLYRLPLDPLQALIIWTGVIKIMRAFPKIFERIADRRPVAFFRRRKKRPELGWHLVRRRVRLRLLLRNE
jgi:hypothetical protein